MGSEQDKSAPANVSNILKEQPVSHSHPRQHSSIPSIYVTHKNPFGQVERFVDDEIERYNLDLLRIPGPMKNALEEYHTQKPDIKAIMVGTRRDDPHGGNNPIDTSPRLVAGEAPHKQLTHQSLLILI